MIAILTLLIAAVGAFGSIYAAVGVTKFKKERAFDRRLDWFERTLKSLTRAQLILSDICRYLPHLEPNELGSLSQLLESLPEAENQLKLYLAEAELYARPASRAAARTLLLHVDEQREYWLGMFPGKVRPTTQFKDIVIALVNPSSAEAKVRAQVKELLAAFGQRKALLDDVAAKLVAEGRQLLDNG